MNFLDPSFKVIFHLNCIEDAYEQIKEDRLLYAFLLAIHGLGIVKYHL